MKASRILVSGTSKWIERDLFGKRIPFWTFKKGEAFDYTNAKLVPPKGQREDDGWSLFGLALVKPEGRSIEYDTWKWEGEVFLGTWWSVRFKTRWFQIYYRRRSWTKDIFYISKD